jgi:hypothetical protein
MSGHLNVATGCRCCLLNPSPLFAVVGEIIICERVLLVTFENILTFNENRPSLVDNPIERFL